MKIAVILLLLFTFAVVDEGSAHSATSATAFVGTWIGSLAVPQGTLPLVFHFIETSGTLSSALDSPMQNATGIVGANMSASDGSITSSYPAVGGTFSGTLSVDGKSLTGTWSQGASLPLTLQKVEPVKIPTPLHGTWSGSLTTPKGGLPLILIFKKDTDGLSTAALQSPKQGPSIFYASSMTYSDGLLTVSISYLNASFSGKLAADGKSLTGLWTQAGRSLPLVLTAST